MGAVESQRRRRVALAGGTGMLGVHIWEAFSDSQYDLTVLVRADSHLPKPSLTATRTCVVDWESDESLRAALQGQDVLISALGKTALALQPRLFSAAVAAGVQRIFPSEFGGDLHHPKTRTFPTYRPKVLAEEQLEQYRAEAGISYTLVFSNVLLDWAISSYGALLINPAKRSATIYDGGNHKFSTTTTRTVGRAIVAALDHYEETANRALYIQDAAITQKELLQIVREVTASDGGPAWDIKDVDTAQAEAVAQETFKSDGISFPVFYGFAIRAAFGQDCGGHFTKCDNDLLGIKEMDAKQLREVVRNCVLPSQ